MQDDLTDEKDLRIIRTVLNGDVNAFEYLLQKYKRDVFCTVQRHVPYYKLEEIAHRVFIRAFKSLKTFEGKSSFKIWLLSIAVRTCHDYWRKKYRQKEVSVSALSDSHKDWLEQVLSEQATRSFDASSVRQEARKVLDWALDQLSAKDRMVLELVYLEGFSCREAARMLGWSVSNVKIRTFRSRKKLRRMLADVIEK